MMIAPESVYFDLKGQPAEKILRAVRAYRREIVHLKLLLEARNRDELDEFMLMPSPETQLGCTRRYLAMARLALEEGGGRYPATDAEKRAEEIYRRLGTLVSVTLERSSVFRGAKRLCAERKGEEFHRSEKIFHRFGNVEINSLPVLSREEFLGALEDTVHIGEWKRSYRPYCLTFDGVEYIDILDGEQWKVCLEFSEGKPLEFFGSNAYPFSFGELVTLLGGKGE